MVTDCKPLNTTPYTLSTRWNPCASDVESTHPCECRFPFTPFDPSRASIELTGGGGEPSTHVSLSLSLLFDRTNPSFFWRKKNLSPLLFRKFLRLVSIERKVKKNIKLSRIGNRVIKFFLRKKNRSSIKFRGCFILKENFES